MKYLAFIFTGVLSLFLLSLLGLSARQPALEAAAPAQATVPPWVRTPRPTSTPRATTLPPTTTIITDVAGIALEGRRDWPTNAYAVVQWQDGWARWNDVENWRGPLTSNAPYPVVWGVYARDFGTGPFRWVVYEREGGPMWGVSAAFYLPAQAGRLLVVPLALVAR